MEVFDVKEVTAKDEEIELLALAANDEDVVVFDASAFNAYEAVTA